MGVVLANNGGVLLDNRGGDVSQKGGRGGG